MRVIELGSDHEQARKRFAIIDSCAFLGRPPADLEGFRNLGKLQDAIEAAADEESVTVEGQILTRRVLKEGVTELVLNDAPFELLKGRFFGAGIDWVTAANRRVLDAFDAVCAAREVKPEDVKIAPPAIVPDERAAG